MIETDLMCCTLADCQVKLAGIFYILTKCPRNATTLKHDVDNSNNSEDEEFLITKSGRQTNILFIMRDRTETDIMASPNLRKNTSKNIILPKFVNHAANCHCVNCTHLHLQMQLLTYVSLAGDALQLERDFDQAFQMYLLVEKLSFQFSCRPHKDFVHICSLPLNKIKEDSKNSYSNIDILRCQTGAKAADLMFRLKKSEECIAYARRSLDVLSKLPKYGISTSPICLAQLRYLLCAASVQLWAKLKSTSISKLFTDKWNYLLPSYLDPVSKISDRNKMFKTPPQNSGSGVPKTARNVPSKLKECRAPVKKTSYLIKKDEDDLASARPTRRTRNTKIPIVRSGDGSSDEEIKFFIDLPVIPEKNKKPLSKSNSVEKLCSDTPFRNECLYTPVPSRIRGQKGAVFNKTSLLPETKVKSRRNKACNVLTEKKTINKDINIKGFESNNIFRSITSEIEPSE